MNVAVRGRPFKKGQSGNPAGKPKGTVNKFTADIKSMVEEALHRAGQNAIERDERKKDMNPGAAYLLEQAENKPELFVPLIRQLLPAKLDLDVTVMHRDMLDVLAQRREQLAQMRDITPVEDD